MKDLVLSPIGRREKNINPQNHLKISYELMEGHCQAYSNSVKQLDRGWKIHTVDKISFKLPLSLMAVNTKYQPLGI